jgi:hypothetical protein
LGDERLSRERRERFPGEAGGAVAGRNDDGDSSQTGTP